MKLKLTLIVILLIFIISIWIISNNIQEGFDPISMSAKNRQIIQQDPDKVYDPIYANIYKQVYVKYSGERIQFEVDDLITKTQLRKYENKGILVDLGCGTGEHLNSIAVKLGDKGGDKKMNVELAGVDNSSSMLYYAKKYDPPIYLRLIKEDILNPDIFANNSITHITCYQFVIYELGSEKNMEKLFQNIHNWLKPGGYFIVHLVDREKFDPVPDVSAPFVGIFPQDYYKKRNNVAKVHFSDYIYNSEFKSKPKSIKATLNEEIIFKNKPIIRRQKVEYIIPTVQKMVDKIGKSGFELEDSTNLDQVEYSYQYIFYFKKT